MHGYKNKHVDVHVCILMYADSSTKNLPFVHDLPLNKSSKMRKKMFEIPATELAVEGNSQQLWEEDGKPEPWSNNVKCAKEQLP